MNDNTITIYVYHDEKLDMDKFRLQVGVKTSTCSEFVKDPNEIANFMIKELKSMVNGIDHYQFIYDEFGGKF